MRTRCRQLNCSPGQTTQTINLRWMNSAAWEHTVQQGWMVSCSSHVSPKFDNEFQSVAFSLSYLTGMQSGHTSMVTSQDVLQMYIILCTFTTGFCPGLVLPPCRVRRFALHIPVVRRQRMLPGVLHFGGFLGKLSNRDGLHVRTAVGHTTQPATGKIPATSSNPNISKPWSPPMFMMAISHQSFFSPCREDLLVTAEEKLRQLLELPADWDRPWVGAKAGADAPEVYW